ncbi:MAG: transposase [Verrucomicrobia bacterium]|nr:transposase [Verrucomicrobiota bacterium]
MVHFVISNELQADVQAIPGELDAPIAVLADSGYACAEQVEALQSDEIEVYVSTGAKAKHQRRRHDFRPKHGRSESAKEPKAEWIKSMKAKLQTDTGRALYARRKQTVEPVFGIIKHVMGFRQFLLRGTEKVSGEWELVTLAYHMKRLWNLKLAAG